MKVSEDFIAVAQSKDVAGGSLHRLEVDGKPVILVRVQGKVCALAAICTHEHADLSEGDLEDETIWCPLHSSGFNVFSGEVTSPPAEIPLDVYDVREGEGYILVSRNPRARD